MLANCHRSVPAIVPILLAGAIAGCASVSANSFRPPTNHTGAPGHSTCLNCHGNPAGGNVTFDFSGLGEYTPGQTYAIEITVSETGQNRFGFSMAARDADAPNVNVGTFSPGSADTTTLGNEVMHLNAPFDTDNDDSHTFEVNWQAPANGVGDVTFYLAANAANGNFSADGGDHIYLRQFTVMELVAMNEPPSFSVPDVEVAVTTGSAVPITGISLADPDAGDGPMTVTLEVSNGLVTVSDSVSGGIAAGGISGNGTGAVTLEGSLAELNATFGDAEGIVYRSNPGFTGSETLALTANDNGNTGPGGEQTGNGAVAITVHPLPALSDLGFGGDGEFQFTLTGVPGLTYLVEFSDDLQTWEFLDEVLLVSESAPVTDPNADEAPSRFYRARQSDP